MNGDAIRVAKRSHAHARPAIAAASAQAVAIEHARNRQVIANQRQATHGLNDFFGRMRVALSSAAAWHAQFRVDTATPVNDQHDLAGRGVHVSVNTNAHTFHCFKCNRSGSRTENSLHALAPWLELKIQRYPN